MRASVTLFWGRYFLPIAYRVPIYGVMGDPIEVPLLEVALLSFLLPLLCKLYIYILLESDHKIFHCRSHR